MFSFSHSNGYHFTVCIAFLSTIEHRVLRAPLGGRLCLCYTELRAIPSFCVISQYFIRFYMCQSIYDGISKSKNYFYYYETTHTHATSYELTTKNLPILFMQAKMVGCATPDGYQVRNCNTIYKNLIRLSAEFTR